MAINTTYGNYVKFIRGSISAWEKLLPEDKNSDTLYFITNPGDSSGKLYLGEKLISGGDSISVNSLKELTDVLIENISDQSILIYNDNKKIWENKSILDVVNAIVEVFQGATAEKAGVAGLVPAPKVGEQDLFLKADSTWANPVQAVELKLNTLIDEDVDKSVRTIALEEVAKVVANAPEQFDTLVEIATWIENNQNIADTIQFETRVQNLEVLLNGDGALNEGLVAQVESNTIDIEDLKKSIQWQIIEE